MSKTVPYLERHRKQSLVEFAKQANLKDYESKIKPELVAALDDHLRANRSRLEGNKTFSEFYDRLSQSTGRASTPLKSARRSPRKVKPEIFEKDLKATTTQDEESSPEPSRDQTPLPRSPGNPFGTNLDGSPMSPSAITDAIDEQTTRLRQHLSDRWEASGMIERSDSLRSMLSSVKAIETIVLLIEGFYMLRDLVPSRYLTTLPPIKALNTSELPIKIPDLFILVNSTFWAPYSLWLFTNLLLPLAVAYFFNLSLKAAQSSRGRVSSRASSFDPLSYNIAKALLAYAVYNHHFTFWDVWSGFSAQRVNSALPWEWPGVVTGTAIGIVGTLYEAILRK